MSASAWVKDVGEENFEAEVLARSETVPVILDFWAEWCGPCRALGPLLERLVEERGGKVILAKVNTDDAPNLASYFRIDGIPAIKAVYRRAIVREFTGLLPETALRQFLDSVIPPDDSPVSDDPNEAEQTYRSRIEANDADMESRVALSKLWFAQGRLDEIGPLLEPVGPDDPVAQEADQVLSRVWLRRAATGLPPTAKLAAKVAAEPRNAQARLDLGIRLADEGREEEALGSLLAAAEADLKLASGKVREAMVKVFFAIGTSHPLANDYRGRLARLLY